MNVCFICEIKKTKIENVLTGEKFYTTSQQQGSGAGGESSVLKLLLI